MNDPNTPIPSDQIDESNDPQSGENDSSDAITGAVEAGWNGSLAGTNDALEPDENTPSQ
ncbi:MAG: hypothetical protein KY445_08565 [Armatimonadetes bacterium]|nr:hypothetical protein [Armatimonadota bacterium]